MSKCKHEYQSDYSLHCSKCRMVVEWDYENVFNEVASWLLKANEQGYTPIDVTSIKKNNVYYIGIKLREKQKVITK